MEPFGVLTEGIDFALVILYTFWLFFFALLFYLFRENRREGFPLVDDMTGKRERGGLIWIPSPKTFLMPNGEVHLAPDYAEVEPPVINAVPASPFPGSPLVPLGNPLTAGVGPGSWAMRQDRADITSEGEVKLVPMRLLPDHWVSDVDYDPRGMEVVGADGMPAGIVEDVWVDRSELMVRYIEVRLDPLVMAETTTDAAPAGVETEAAVAVDLDTGEAAVAVVTEPAHVTAGNVDTVLMPMTTATIAGLYSQVSTPSITAAQFADVPRLKHPNEVTLLEEDKIMAYYSAGELYATRARSEPLL